MKRLTVFAQILILMASCAHHAKRADVLNPRLAEIKIADYDVENVPFTLAFGHLQIIVNKELPEEENIFFSLQADRIVVRDGGMDCCGPVDDDPVLFELTDQKEINNFIENLKIVKEQVAGGCLCCGKPGIDFYKGEKRLALTSLKHGYAIWWKKLPSQATLTRPSREWIRAWLLKHGVPEDALR